MVQQQIPGTARTKNARAEKISEELREQLAQNAAGRAREKELRKQLLSELLGDNPEAKELLEQLVALLDERPPAYRYVDGQGIGIESILNFKLEAKVHPTGEQEPAVGEGVPEKAERPRRAKKTDEPKEFDEDSIPDPDDESEQAAAAQRSNNVEEDEDGDVVVPEKSAPKKSRKKSTKKARRK